MTEYTEYMDYVNQLQQLSSVNFERLNGLITTVGFFKGVTYAPQHCLELMAALTAYDDSHFAIVVNPQLKFASLIHRGKSLVDQHSMIQQLGDLKVVHLETICQDPDTHFPGVGANHQVELFSFYEQRIGIIRKLEREEWQKRELKASHGIISTPAASLPVAVETAVQQLKAPAAVTKRTTRNTAVAPQAPTEIDKTIESHRAILFAHAGNEHLQKIIQGECRKLTPERIAAVVIKLKEQEEEIQNVERPFLKVLEILRSRP